MAKSMQDLKKAQSIDIFTPVQCLYSRKNIIYRHIHFNAYHNDCTAEKMTIPRVASGKCPSFLPPRSDCNLVMIKKDRGGMGSGEGRDGVGSGI